MPPSPASSVANTDDAVAGALDPNALRAAHEVLEEDKLQLRLEGFSGPIDLLLDLARDQKVDWTQISILQLADQYLEFISGAKALRIELAADYLVMAAWLAYLKSCLLLPTPEIDEEDAHPHLMAKALRYRLQRLEAMREAAGQLMARPQLGRDRFASGGDEVLREETRWEWTLSFYDLIGAYARMEVRQTKHVRLRIAMPSLFSVDDSVARMRRLFGEMRPAWHSLAQFLPQMGERAEPLVRKSALASTFAAVLELCRDGQVEVRQDGAFQPIFIKPVAEDADDDEASNGAESTAESSAEPLGESL